MPKKDELNDRRQLAILMHKYKAGQFRAASSLITRSVFMIQFQLLRFVSSTVMKVRNNEPYHVATKIKAVAVTISSKKI